MTVFAGGEGPAPDGTGVPSGAGHIPCVICVTFIRPAEYRSARVWTDPMGITCAAHDGCLVRVGERDQPVLFDWASEPDL